MYDFLLTPEEQELKKEVRQFVREEISSDFLRKMDNDDITYPREFVEKLAAKGLRGIRFPKKYGGREMSWVADVTATEEIGCLGMALGCAFVMPSIVGEALNMFGTEDQKQKYLKPYIAGELVWRRNTFTASWDAGEAAPGDWCSEMLGCQKKTWWVNCTGALSVSTR
jgi:acyl-CoA dehydrogenase